MNDEVTGGENIQSIDRRKLLIPSFIEKPSGAVYPEIYEFKNIQKRSNSRSSQGGEGANIKLKARIGSANMTNVLKEKLTVKRQQRNQNAT